MAEASIYNRAAMVALDREIKRFFDCKTETEYWRDRFEPFSGQIGRISWYVPGGELELCVRLYDDNTHTLTAARPTGSQQTPRQANPCDLATLAHRASEYSRETDPGCENCGGPHGRCECEGPYGRKV